MIFITDELGKFEKNIIELAENVGFKECKTIEAIDLFCGISERNDVLKEKDRYYAFIDIPQYWSVRADGLNGAIYDNKTKKANIYFKNPIEKRMVSRVEWIDRNNTVYKVDYYNKYGYMYCSENVSGGNVTVREFYDRNGDIKVLEQTGPKTYTTFGTRISPKSYRGFADYLEAYLKYNKIYDENIWLTSDEILNKFAWDYGNFKISYLPQNRLNSDLTVITQTNTAFRITDIPPYDTRMDFGISSQLRVQNILVPVDGLTEDAFARIIKGLADYLIINDLARVHFFTRDASWGHEDAIKNDTVKLLDSMGYDSRLVTGDGEAALGFGGSGADAFAENELVDMEKPVEQRFFVDVCVDERDISKCINEQRVILDMRGTMDVFVYVTAISKGVPRISLSADQFLISGKNGMVIDDFSDIGRSLTYYLDSFENWNQALVECYELGQKYTTSVLLKKWRKVLNFSE